MAEKKLKRFVTVAGATYGPDDTLPKGVAEQIDNPAAFEDPDDATPAEVAARKASAEAVDSGTSKSGK